MLASRYTHDTSCRLADLRICRAGRRPRPDRSISLDQKFEMGLLTQVIISRLRMITAVLVFNSQGKPRLSKFYIPEFSTANRFKLVETIYNLVSSRVTFSLLLSFRSATHSDSVIVEQPDNVCNFVDLPSIEGIESAGEEFRVIYRHYATLYFVFIVDQSESELGILDLIQVSFQSPGLSSSYRQKQFQN